MGARDRMVHAKRQRRFGRRMTVVLGLLAAGTILLVVWRVSSSGGSGTVDLDRLRDDRSVQRVDDETVARIKRFCSDCHGLPRPDNYPRDTWRKAVERGFEAYAKSGRRDLDPPAMHLVIAYFRSRAPAQQVFPEPQEAETKLQVAFAAKTFTLGPHPGLPPAVSHLRWTRLDPKDRPVLLACDMRQGTVAAVDLDHQPPQVTVLAQLNQPAHMEPCDLDGDGALDLVVADLGSYFPDDHDRGRVVWLQRDGAPGTYRQVVIASGLGRVADARPADFDGDGDLDLVVAEFGADRTGNILLLTNVATAGQAPRFEPEELDPRPGTIHVPVCDLDGDGLLDFVALISQEYECIEAFLNQADGGFHRQTLWAGPDSAFGSSGIELVDLDRDGDVDILYTNGDSFDDGYIKPCHGVAWLENDGDLHFTYHRLTHLAGAYRALAGDIDGDGDLDVVATAWVAPQVAFLNRAAKKLASVVCMEQTSPGQFVRHTLETGFPYYATCELADFDGDGDLDLALGAHSIESTQPLPYSLAIWWNQGTGQGD